MKNLKNYVWTLPSVVLLVTMCFVQSCSDGNTDINGNPALAIKAIEQDYRLWALCWFTLIFGAVLAMVFYYQLQSLKKNLKEQGFNV